MEKSMALMILWSIKNRLNQIGCNNFTHYASYRIIPATYNISKKKAHLTELASQSVEMVINSATVLTGSVTISGNPKVGETLTAINAGTNAVSLGYQWKRVNGLSKEDIPSATSKTYVLTADDIGKSLL